MDVIVMRKRSIVFALLLLLPALHAGAAQRLTIIHTNDLHSHLLPFSPEIDFTQATGDDTTRGGWARIAGIIHGVRQEAKNPVLLFDAGDFLMGSLFHMVCREHALELQLMREMRYDAITFGNHEFDLTPGSLARILAAARRSGGMPAIVASNYIFSPTDERDDTMEKTFSDGWVRPYTVIERGGVRIGVFGHLGKNAAEVSPFASPMQFEDILQSAPRMVQALRGKENADLVVCLSHAGYDPAYEYYEDANLARKVPGIDIIISGHTHTPVPEPVMVGDTIIVHTGVNGLHVGVLDIEVGEGKTRLVGYRLVPVDDRVREDGRIAGLIRGFREIVEREVLRPHGLTFHGTMATTGFDLNWGEREINLGNLITDAMRWKLNGLAARDKTGDKIDVAIEACGLIRDDVLRGKTGRVTASDLFRAFPMGIGVDDTMGYPLCAVYVTAAEIKKGLEVLTSLYPLKGGDFFLQVSGGRCRYNPYRMIFDRITDIELGTPETGYRRLDYSSANKKLYLLTANLYVATFLKIVGDYTMGFLRIVPRDRNGNPVTDIRSTIIDGDPSRKGVQEVKEWVALMEYVQSFKDTDGDGVPNIPATYAGPEGRIVARPSWSPAALLAGGGALTWGVFGVMVAIAAGLAALIRMLVRRFRK